MRSSMSGFALPGLRKESLELLPLTDWTERELPRGERSLPRGARFFSGIDWFGTRPANASQFIIDNSTGRTGL